MTNPFPMPTGADELFPPTASAEGIARMDQLLRDADISQITADGPSQVIYISSKGSQTATGVFRNERDYIDWVNSLLRLTDVSTIDIEDAGIAVVEGSFDPLKINVHGSIHVCTRELTAGPPTVTIRKQPIDRVTLGDMQKNGMMDSIMAEFAVMAMRGRSNILISGGSGAGKTTFARALGSYIDPRHRVVTCEEIDELHIRDIHKNTARLTTKRIHDGEGRLIRESTLAGLVKETLRMRADRVWVGETRGGEAYALVKACNSGHDGSVTTIHGDNGQQALMQCTTYVMENPNMLKETAQEQVARAFDLVIQIGRGHMGRRVITEISEVSDVIENGMIQTSVLFEYDHTTDRFKFASHPSPRFRNKWQRHGANYEELFPSSQHH